MNNKQRYIFLIYNFYNIVSQEVFSKSRFLEYFLMCNFFKCKAKPLQKSDHLDKISKAYFDTVIIVVINFNNIM